MKKYVIFFILLLFILCPITMAYEKNADGWYVVPKKSEVGSDKQFSKMEKDWVYYEDGIEIMRFSDLYGAHRGWGDAPENSLASFIKTREHGLYTFETDVRFTASTDTNPDGVPVLAHDNNINIVARNKDLSVITGDKIYFRNITFEDLISNYVFNVERLNHGESTTDAVMLEGYDNNTITTFEEMLDYAKANKMLVTIDLKSVTVNQVKMLINMINARNMHNSVRFCSCYVTILERILNVDSTFNVYLFADTCDESNPSKYCGENSEEFYARIKGNDHYVWMSGYNGKVKVNGEYVYKYSDSEANEFLLPSVALYNLPSKYTSMKSSSDAAVLTPIPMGDVNGNGAVNRSDAMIIAKYIIGYTVENNINIAQGDINKDNKIKMNDVMRIINNYL